MSGPWTPWPSPGCLGTVDTRAPGQQEPDGALSHCLLTLCGVDLGEGRSHRARPGSTGREGPGRSREVSGAHTQRRPLSPPLPPAYHWFCSYWTCHLHDHCHHPHAVLAGTTTHSALTAAATTSGALAALTACCPPSHHRSIHCRNAAVPPRLLTLSPKSTAVTPAVRSPSV